MNEENFNQKRGLFSASNISRLLSGGAGRTRHSYILEVATEAVTGERKIFETSATKHGIANQMNAFEFVLKPIFKGIQWFDTFIPINSNCGASPDAILGNTSFDIKCPYEIDTFLEQINKIKPSYFSQKQMQIIATKGVEGYLCIYLTKKEEWGSDTWEEYPLPLEDRYYIYCIKKDEEHCDLILSEVERAAPIRDIYIEKLLNTDVMDEIEYFYHQMKHNKFRPISQCSNIESAKLIRVKNKFYYEVK